MPVSLYITHPEVLIDPLVPVPQWGLSDTGRQRAEAFGARDLLPAGALFVASDEVKALELANILANASNGQVLSDAAFGENDRSSTGFLPADEFEAMADRFFAEPARSAEGWERASDAQYRIVSAVTGMHARYPETPLVFCGHGAVGTLLKCHLGGRAISRKEDQPGGGGNIFAFNLAAVQLLCDWTRMEDFEGI